MWFTLPVDLPMSEMEILQSKWMIVCFVKGFIIYLFYVRIVWDGYMWKLLHEEFEFAKKRRVAISVHRNSLVSCNLFCSCLPLPLKPLFHITTGKLVTSAKLILLTQKSFSVRYFHCCHFMCTISTIHFQHSVYQSKVFLVMQLIVSWSFALKYKCLWLKKL